METRRIPWSSADIQRELCLSFGFSVTPPLDLAAIRVFPGCEEMPCFQPGLLPFGQDYPDAEPVRLYAYTVGAGGIRAHYEFGHIYQHFERDGTGGRPHVSYELTFRAYHGNSGGPVFRDKNRHEAVAVITGGVVISRRDSGLGTHRAVALPLLSVLPWLEVI